MLKSTDIIFSSGSLVGHPAGYPGPVCSDGLHHLPVWSHTCHRWLTVTTFWLPSPLGIHVTSWWCSRCSTEGCWCHTIKRSRFSHCQHESALLHIPAREVGDLWTLSHPLALSLLSAGMFVRQYTSRVSRPCKFAFQHRWKSCDARFGKRQGRCQTWHRSRPHQYINSGYLRSALSLFARLELRANYRHVVW